MTLEQGDEGARFYDENVSRTGRGLEYRRDTVRGQKIKGVRGITPVKSHQKDPGAHRDRDNVDYALR